MAITALSKQRFLGWFAFIAIVFLAGACGGERSNASPRAAAQRMLATGFSVKETSSSTSPIASGNYTLDLTGRLTSSAIVASANFKLAASPRLIFTVYATKHEYCHLGADLAGGGFCERGDGYETYITLESLPYLRDIASGQSSVRIENGGMASFSGSATSSSFTYGRVHSHWSGNLVVSNGEIVNMTFTSSDSLGGVAHASASFSHFGDTQPIAAPPGAGSHF
jgi:hypothetical protein